MKTSNGYTPKADTASSSDWGNRRWMMFKVGEVVTYAGDGARGIILDIKGEQYLVMWEDTFVSLEKAECLRKEGATE
jgi:hypothetical protein